MLAALVEDGYLEEVGDGLHAVTDEGRLVLGTYKGRFMGQVPVSNYP